MLQLEYIHANASWSFTFGNVLLQMDDYPRFFPTREEAVNAANSEGLVVSNDDVVATSSETPDLLDALKCMTALAQNIRNAIESGQTINAELLPNAYFNQAWAAIAKAEGK